MGIKKKAGSKPLNGKENPIPVTKRSKRGPVKKFNPTVSIQWGLGC
jgi:hypothetical protein